MKHTIKQFISMGIAAQAGLVCAAFVAGTGYQSAPYYTNPHPDAAIVSFDWDDSSNLYYSTRSPVWDLGFAVYRSGGAAPEILHQDTNVFSGSRVTAIGGMIYFNDGGNYEQWNYNYFRYNPASAEAPTNLDLATDLWGLETRDGSDFWAAGGANAAIYHSALDANGDLVNNPPVNLGSIGQSSGPLAFDAAGNLYYAEGYNTAGSAVYRWSAAEVAAALADPAGAPLQPDGHIWSVLASGDGSTGIQADPDGHVLAAATSFAAPSELHRLLILNGVFIGYEVVARADERLETVRLRGGAIYASTAEGVFSINAAQTLRLIAQAGQGGALTLIGLNDQGQALRLATVADSAPGWVVRGIDGNRLLAQAGDGGAVAIVELDANSQPANIVMLANAVPGWIVRALDGNRILAQAGDGGMVGIQELGPGYSLGNFSMVAGEIPGWIARDLDGNRLLAQAGDGGAAAIAQLDGAGHLAGYTIVAESIPGWIVRGLAGHLLLAQAGDGGMSIVMELTDAETPAGYRLVLNPAPGQALLGMDFE